MKNALPVVLLIGALTGCTDAGGDDAPQTPISPQALTAADLDGGLHLPFADANHRAVVLIFISTDCPIANQYAPEISRITAEYEPRGVKVYLVHADADTTPGAARSHADSYALRATVLLDHDQSLVKATGVQVTPEAVVVSPAGAVLYRGRIDNRFADLGQPRTLVSEHDLRDALDAVLAGRPVANPRTKALGCFIPKISR